MALSETSLSLRYNTFGDPEVLEFVTGDAPHAADHEVRVRVLNVGLNPVDTKIFRGRAPHFAVPLPAGVGNDFSGIIDEIGPGVTGWTIGDAVYGGARHRALAEHLVLPAVDIYQKPDELSFEQAGALDIVARTASAVVDAVNITASDTVLVSAAAGGVGVLVSQLAIRRGARVIGTASPSNHAFLTSLGVTPVTYGDDLIDRVRNAAPEGISAVCDQHGQETVDLARELGVPTNRVNSIAAKPFAAEHGFGVAGGAEAKPGSVAAIAALIAERSLVLPIDRIFPFEHTADAYRFLLAGHLRGKVVVRVASP